MFTVSLCLLPAKRVAFLGVLRVEEQLGNRCEEVWTGSRGIGRGNTGRGASTWMKEGEQRQSAPLSTVLDRHLERQFNQTGCHAWGEPTVVAFPKKKGKKIYLTASPDGEVEASLAGCSIGNFIWEC